MVSYAVEDTRYVQRNMDLIREVLLKIEENSEMDGTRSFMLEQPEQLGITGYPVEEVAYHVKLLIKEKLLDGDARGYSIGIVRSLTWDGHEFLDNIRDPGIWGNVKKRLDGLPSVAVSLMAQIATAEVKKRLGLP